MTGNKCIMKVTLLISFNSNFTLIYVKLFKSVINN